MKPSPPGPNLSLAVSIVSYDSDLDLLRETLASLTGALVHAAGSAPLDSAELYLVDNGPGDIWRGRLEKMLREQEIESPWSKAELISGQGNVGCGGGHNLALGRTAARYHLALNPDVALRNDALLQALRFMERNTQVDLLAPAAVNEHGAPLYLCKRYPSVLDLALRALPGLRSLGVFRKRLERYEMRDVIGAEAVEVPTASGCFMFLRKSALDRLGGFDPRYFVYFEDFDLSLRVTEAGKAVYAPAVRISHYGGKAATKGWRHIRRFIVSGFIFFHQHGWKFW